MTDHAQQARGQQIKQAILHVVNTAFACGQWGSPEDGDFQTLVDESDNAQAQLRKLIAALTRAAEEAVKDMAQRKDAAYLERNQVVAALAKCFPSGIARTAIEGWSEDWHGCVYIDLPTGQVSWHYHDSQAPLFAGLPPYTKPWDGHSTEEKYRRVSQLQSAQPVWSDKPTVAGGYWVRHDGYEPVVMNVKDIEGCGFVVGPYFKPLEECDGWEFAGPLPMPREA